MSQIVTTRRGAFGRLGLMGLAMAGSGSLAAIASRAEAQDITDADILQFALNLEYFETEFYLRATTGQGLDDADAGADRGKVTGGRKVDFQTAAIREFGEEIAENELGHVRFYRSALGSAAVSRPAIDLEGGFAAVAKAIGLPDFDPFANEVDFLLAGMLIEDAGVTAYAAAVPLLQNKDYVAVAASVLAVEAYHMGMARSQLYQMGERAITAANAISDARNALDGEGDKDQHLRVNGKANFVPSDANGMAFRRSPQEILRIVYLAGTPGVSRGGFFPEGLNGALRAT
jgi:hypothetical protein